jgi:hypothetical protein
MPNADLVLEGGGVKGLGLIGAVERLMRAGYSFQRVAGTSAGSIVAALVAAGASADKLAEVMGRLAYARVPDRGPPGVPGVSESISLLRSAGAYEGDYLREFVYEELGQLGVRTFGDLRRTDRQADKNLKPYERYKLVVMATDVTRGRLLRLPWDYRLLNLTDESPPNGEESPFPKMLQTRDEGVRGVAGMLRVRDVSRPGVVPSAQTDRPNVADVDADDQVLRRRNHVLGTEAILLEQATPVDGHAVGVGLERSARGTPKTGDLVDRDHAAARVGQAPVEHLAVWDRLVVAKVRRGLAVGRQCHAPAGTRASLEASARKNSRAAVTAPSGSFRVATPSATTEPSPRSASR